MKCFSPLWLTLIAGSLLVGLGGWRWAAADEGAQAAAVQRGVAYLETRGQAADGSFSAASGPGVTALATTALLRSGQSVDSPAVVRALAYLQQFVHADGGIYQEGSNYQNYETCLAMLCLGEANRNGRYDTVLERAGAFIRGLQWDEGEGLDASDYRYGGAGYGSHKRPDLSNTTFFVEALQSQGAGPQDPAIARALVFISRCQNLESAYNTTPFGALNPDGGFYYTPAAGGVSQAGTTETGGLRSYGSMTYAGLKSMIYAGVGPEDPRVQAAVAWIRAHYGLESNPGLGNAGLYYYYHTFAKALHAMKATEFSDAQGVTHDWRAELAAELARRQQADGSWINDNQRWLEADPNLVTSYALLALSYCRPAPDGAGREAGSAW